MSSSTTEASVARARNVTVAEDTLTVELSDGRSISVPLVWYPRLVHGTLDERSNWLVGRSRRRHSLARARRGHQPREPPDGPSIRGKPELTQAMVVTARLVRLLSAPKMTE
jgi:hypothetical protein